MDKKQLVEDLKVIFWSSVIAIGFILGALFYW